jgi:hypothetical protein
LIIGGICEVGGGAGSNEAIRGSCPSSVSLLFAIISNAHEFMTYKATIYRIFIASPSDVSEERKVIREVISEWNVNYAESRGIYLEAVGWESHATPELGERPQSILNRQLVDVCDLLVGVFWTKLGTPTGEAESGTVEEIERFSQADKPVILYFCDRPVNPDSLEINELTRLRGFKETARKSGLYGTFASHDDLRRSLLRAINRHVTKLHEEDVVESATEATKDNKDAIALAKLNAFAQRIESEWETEKDAEPVQIEVTPR